MQKISVLLPNLFSVCTYYADVKLPAGTFVDVPFGRAELTGVVWRAPVDESFPENKIKSVSTVCDLPPLSDTMQKFIDWVSDYTL